MKKLTLMLMLALALFVVACGGAEPVEEPTEEPEPTVAVEEPTEEPEMEAPSIAEIAAADGSFTTLVAALEAAGLVETLASEGEYTVFAPTDDAFAALPEGTVEALLEDPEGDLTQILLYHVVGSVAMAEDVVGLDSVITLQGEEVSIAVEDGNVILNGVAMVTATDIEASNGVIHVIDAVILPPSMTAEEMLPSIAEIAAGDESFGTLVAALDAAGLVETLAGEGEFTVFAPTDDAFAALPEGLLDTLLEDPAGDLTDILLYHVVEGAAFAEDVVGLESVTTLQGSDITITVTDDGVFLNEVIQVITTDIEANNGVIHVIDGVLVPESGSMEDEEMMEIDPNSIAGIAAADETFSTLVAALDAAGLVETLAGEGEFTVFAPTNDAFAALPEGTVEALLEDPSGDLTQILLYHVVSGVALAEDVVGLESVTTLQGADVSITVTDDGVFLNDTVQVITTDIEASNGVIHVIDGVLLPSAEDMEGSMDELPTIAEIAAEAGTFETLLTALDAAGLAEAFADPEFGPVTVFAPTDDAFAALPDGTLESLLEDPEGALTDILRYHVVPGVVLAEDVVMLESATTDLGQDVTITVTDDGVFLNDTVQIVMTDLMASNGVVHVIDAVLIPAE